MNKHKQMLTEMFHKQDVTAYLIYIKRLKYAKFSTSHSRIHLQI